MLKVNAIGFARASACLAEIRCLMESIEGKHVPISEENIELAKKHFYHIIDSIAPLNMPYTNMAIARLLKDMEERKFSFGTLSVRYLEIERRFFDELGAVFLYTVDSKNAELFNPSEPPFGETVAEKLPELAYDIDEAGKCLALRRSTACVLHLNRVLEGLTKRICKRLRISQSERAIGLLLSDIDSAIKSMKKGRRKESWSALRAHLFHVKEAWRNPSAHARNVYTEEDAEAIYAAMRFLVRHYAEKL